MNTHFYRIILAVVLLAVLSPIGEAAVVAPTMTDTYYGSSFLKNRYLTIDPLAGGANAGKSFGIRVTLTDSAQFADAAGMTWWVGEPDENCLAGLVDTVVYHTWDACPELHVTGCGIVPASTYRLIAEDVDGDSPDFLDHATVPRPGIKWWGDTVGQFNGSEWSQPQGCACIDDTLAIIKSWQYPGTALDTTVPVADIHPREPNRLVNFDDVFTDLMGYTGALYPFGCPHDPCWDNWTTPCP